MKRQSFEDGLQRLEEILQRLEQGDLPLEKALKTFEEGMRLVRFCSQQLDEVEKKVEILLQDEEGRLTPQPFGEPGEDSNR